MGVAGTARERAHRATLRAGGRELVGIRGHEVAHGGALEPGPDSILSGQHRARAGAERAVVQVDDLGIEGEGGQGRPRSIEIERVGHGPRLSDGLRSRASRTGIGTVARRHASTVRS